VAHNRLGDEGLRPLFEALPLNTHLRTLDVSWNDMNAAFAHDVLLPAVHSNASLRKLRAAMLYGDDASLHESEAFVSNRAAATH
jgi:hypothetical protein